MPHTLNELNAIADKGLLLLNKWQLKPTKANYDKISAYGAKFNLEPKEIKHIQAYMMAKDPNLTIIP
jgi:hypothetical protein